MAKKKQRDITIWHKSNCVKSCEVMNVFKAKKMKPLVFEYLVTTPTEEEISDVLQKLGIPAESLVRKKEPIYKEKFAGKKMTEAKWIKALAKYPILIERPIIIEGDKAFIGRPTEKVVEFLK